MFTRVPELVAAIDAYIAQHNINPKPFIWTKSARDILQKVIRANARLKFQTECTTALVGSTRRYVRISLDTITSFAPA